MSPGPLKRWLRFLQLIWAPAEAEILSRRQLPGLHPRLKD